LESVDRIRVDHISGSAFLIVSGTAGRRALLVKFIRDGGRWYLYVPEC
jgi:hypothetical protein